MKSVIIALFMVCTVGAGSARAYIDPGTGGYLFSSFFAIVLGALAFGSAFFLYIYRYTIGAVVRSLGHKKRFDPRLSGVHIYAPDEIAAGYNLYDGRLIDRDGRLVKEWRAGYLSLLLPDRRYVAQEHYESDTWGVYTWNDEPLWQKQIPIHHDIILTPRDTLLTITKETHLYKKRDVDFCVLVEYDLDGQECWRWSTWDHLAELQDCHAPLELDRPRHFFIPETARRKTPSPWGGQYDYYRLNAVQVLPDTERGRYDSRFQAGNIVISFRHGSMIFILDRQTQEIVWQCIYKDVAHNIEGQHSPQLLPGGNMLIFDNGRYRGWSRVIEIDPVSFQIVWEYAHSDFFPRSQGYAQRLANGNTLITESEKGHVFEVTPDKRIVWEYYHPEIQSAENSRFAKSYGTRQWIYRMQRYDIDID
jgi:hypothetical protein